MCLPTDAAFAGIMATQRAVHWRYLLMTFNSLSTGHRFAPAFCSQAQELARLGPTAYFGERALLKNEPRAATVQAATGALVGCTWVGFGLGG